MIGDDIEVVLTRIERDSVRIAIKAPQSVRIFRGELYHKGKTPGADPSVADDAGQPGSDADAS